MNEKEKKLIDIEAKMLYLKHKIEWLENFIENRITIKEAQTGNHFPQVDDRVIELAKTILGELREKLQQFRKQYGQRPFTEYMNTMVTAIEEP